MLEWEVSLHFWINDRLLGTYFSLNEQNCWLMTCHTISSDDILEAICERTWELEVKHGLRGWDDEVARTLCRETAVEPKILRAEELQTRQDFLSLIEVCEVCTVLRPASNWSS